MAYIVAFPGQWYLRQLGDDAIITGSADRATRFASYGDAEGALKATRRFKREAKRQAQILGVVEG